MLASAKCKLSAQCDSQCCRQTAGVSMIAPKGRCSSFADISFARSYRSIASPQQLKHIGLYDMAAPARLGCRTYAATYSGVVDSDEMCSLQDCQSQLSFPMTVPIMPFTPCEALAPGATKVIHLWEDKDIQMLESVLLTAKGNNSEQQPAQPPVFVHTTIEMGGPRGLASSTPGALVAGNFVFFLSTLVQVLHVEPGIHGGYDVTVRGEGRVRVEGLQQLNPFITGRVWPLQDILPSEMLLPDNTSQNHVDLVQVNQTTQPADATNTPYIGHTESIQGSHRHDPQERNGSLTPTDGDRCHSTQLPKGASLDQTVAYVRQAVEDIQNLLCKLGQTQGAQALDRAIHWADNALPVMCNLASTSMSAELHGHSTHEADSGNSARLDQGEGLLSEGQHNYMLQPPAMPCKIAHLDRVTRLSFALLQVLPFLDKATSESHQYRGAMSILDTQQRLQLAARLCDEARARLAAKSSLLRVRHQL